MAAIIKAEIVAKRRRIIELYNIVFATSSESESDSDDDAEINILLLPRNETVLKPRVMLFIENVVDQYSEVDFKSHFRLTRRTFGILENMISNQVMTANGAQNGAGHPVTEPRKQILLALWILGNPESYRSVCNLFNVGKATGQRCVRRVVDAVFNMAPVVIKWPSSDSQEALAAAFNRSASFPGVIGCIDGCHIPIQAPALHPANYVNRKHFHSIVLQGVCNNRMLFTHCYAGEVGSVHDARVLRLSEINGYLRQPALNKFISEEHHILGDAAYPVLTHLMPPYKDNGHLTARQRSYNYRLSSTRMVIERTFGLLKGRWRRLKKLCMSRADLIPRTIIACCVLHNICVLQNDPQFEFPEELEENNEPEPNIPRGFHHIPNDANGVVKRNRIMHALPPRDE